MKLVTMAAVVLAAGATSGVASAQARAFRVERPDVGSAQAARAERAALHVQPRLEAVRVRSEAADRGAERAIARAQASGHQVRVVTPPAERAAALAREHGVIERQPRGDGTSAAAPVALPPGATQVPQRVRCADGQPSCGAASREGVLPAPARVSAEASEEQLRAILKRVRDAIAERVSRYARPDPEA